MSASGATGRAMGGASKSGVMGGAVGRNVGVASEWAVGGAVGRT